MKHDKQSRKINSSGFSLLEILIYIAAVAVITTVIGGVFLSIAGGQARADASAEINSNLRFASDKINQDIFSASAITSPALAGETAGALTMVVGAGQISYCVVNNRLYRAASGVCNESAEPLTSPAVKINNLTFTRLENINSVSAKTTVSIQTAIIMGSTVLSQYSITKQITSTLR